MWLKTAYGKNRAAFKRFYAPMLVRSSNSACRPWLMRVRTTRKTNTTIRTTPVDFKTLGNVGQVTLLSSEKVSLSFLPILTKILGFLTSFLLAIFSP